MGDDRSHAAVAPGPIFAQPWWLDAVAPGRWDAITIERGGRIVARFPYVVERRRGRVLLTMPPLTQSLGPWWEHSSGKYATRLSQEKRLLGELIDRLPPFDHFRQRFHHSVVNWLPFYWRGFEQTTRYTYRIDDLTDPDAVWAGMKDSIRWAIRKARTRVAVRDDLDLDAFLRLNDLTFRRQGLRPPYGDALVRRLDAACDARGCRRMLFAEDASGRLHAAVYIVWDGDSAYYLMGGSDPAHRDSAAASLLLWEAIRSAADVTAAFDFEGSMNPRIEQFFAAFGARQTPYFAVTRTDALALRIRRDVRAWLRSRAGGRVQ